MHYFGLKLAVCMLIQPDFNMTHETKIENRDSDRNSEFSKKNLCCPYLAFNSCLCCFAIFSKTCTMKKLFIHCTCLTEYCKTT